MNNSLKFFNTVLICSNYLRFADQLPFPVCFAKKELVNFEFLSKNENEGTISWIPCHRLQIANRRGTRDAFVQNENLRSDVVVAKSRFWSGLVLILFTSIEEVQENYRRDCQRWRDHWEETLEDQKFRVGLRFDSTLDPRISRFDRVDCRDPMLLRYWSPLPRSCPRHPNYSRWAHGGQQDPQTSCKADARLKLKVS